MQWQVSTTNRHQSALARYCLTGSYEPIPGVRDRHVHHYRRLVYNVVDDILQSAYPLTCDLLSRVEWEDLVHRFLASHPCQTPQVWQMPRELYEFVESEGSPSKYPFLSELLYFEWLEVELFMMEDKAEIHKADGDVFIDPLVLNPEHILQHFHYPVHLKKAKSISFRDKGDYYLVMFRHPASRDVQFMTLSPALVYLVEQLAAGPISTDALIREVCDALQIPIQQDTTSTVLKFITRSLENKLIVGFEVKQLP